MKSKKAILWVIGVGVLLAGCRFEHRLEVKHGPSDAATFARDHGEPRDPRWPTARKHFREKHPECWGCGEPTEQVHHVIPFGVDESKLLDESNMAPVCNECHFEICHGRNYHTYNPNCVRDLKAYRKLRENCLPIKKAS